MPCSSQQDHALNELDAARAKASQCERKVLELQTQLEEVRTNNSRLQRESEILIENIDKWVDEQKCVQ